MKVICFAALASLCLSAACAEVDMKGRSGRTNDSADATAQNTGPAADLPTTGPKPERERPPSREDKPETQNSKPVTVKVPCNEARDTPSRAEIPSSDQVVFEGDVCVPVERSEVLFLVDVSGSMKDADPRRLDTCGRQDAVVAILEKLSDDAQVSIVTFSGRAETILDQVPRAAIDMQQLATSLCEAVRETNYEIAFREADALLAGNALPFLYLISDGLPEVFGQPDAEARGLAAAELLRANHPNVTVNAVFLGTDPLDSRPAQYLADITGDPSHVALADDAAGLADAIVALEAPMHLTAAALSIELHSDAAKPQFVAVKRLTALPSGGWHFESAKFRLDSSQSERLTFVLRRKGIAEPLSTAAFYVALDSRADQATPVTGAP